MNDFPKFTGSIDDQDTYNDTAESIFGKITFKFLMECDAVTDAEKERDSKLYYVFM